MYDSDKVPVTESSDSYKVFRDPPSLETAPTARTQDHGQSSSEPDPQHQPENPEKRRYRTWHLIAAGLAGLVIAGAAVGGGLGSQIKSCSRSTSSDFTCNSPTNSSLSASLSDCTANSTSLQTSLNSCLANSSISTTEYVPLAPLDVNSLNNTCQGGVYTIRSCPSDSCTKPAKFKTYCNKLFDSKDKMVHSPNKMSNLIGTVAYTLESCIQTCDNYNQQQIWNYRTIAAGKNIEEATWCWSVVWYSELSQRYTEAGANCWLRNNSWADTSGGETAMGTDIAVLAQNAEYVKGSPPE